MRCARALPIHQLMPAASSRRFPVATRCLGGLPGKNERPHPSPARTPGTPSIIMSPDRRPWTQISSLVPFGDARACGKIGRGRSPSISRPWRARGANRADARSVSCGFTITRSDFRVRLGAGTPQRVSRTTFFTGGRHDLNHHVFASSRRPTSMRRILAGVKVVRPRCAAGAPPRPPDCGPPPHAQARTRPNNRNNQRIHLYGGPQHR